jgi:TPR repeat protein
VQNSWINMPEAIKWYQLAAAQDQSGAQHYLGRCYLAGKGVEQDEQHGLDLIRRAAGQNHTDSLRTLADLYTHGIGEPRNDQDRPMQLLQRAVQNEPGSRLAYDAIIYRCQYGPVTERDLVVAAQWYGRAAMNRASDYWGRSTYSLVDKLNLGPPKQRLGAFTGSERAIIGVYLPDEGGPSDRLLAMISLYLKAATMNDPKALRSIGKMYFNGEGVPLNPAKAWTWLTLAAEKGDAVASAKIADMEANMTKGQINDAKSMLPDLVQELKAIASATR